MNVAKLTSTRLVAVAAAEADGSGNILCILVLCTAAGATDTKHNKQSTTLQLHCICYTLML